MLFDSTLLLYHSGSAFSLTAGEFSTMAGVTSTSASATINLGNARDLGINQGQETPQIAIHVGTAFTSSSASMLINFAFQGSTDSSTWTTYAETGANSTASYAVGYYVLPIAVPRRPSGASLPLYYRMYMTVSGTGGTPSISTGTLLGGIVLARSDVTVGQYPAGFVVV